MDDLDDSIAASPAAPFFRPVLTVTAEEVAACGEDVTSRGVPVLVKGGINSWPCAGKWSFEYIADNVGSGWAFNWNFKPKHKDVYLAQWSILDHAPHLIDDIRQRSLWRSWWRFVWTHVFIGPAGTVTGLHNDDNPNMFASVRGSKDWILFPPGNDDALQPGTKYDYGAQCSIVDISQLSSMPAHVKASFQRARGGVFARVEPGDMLYVPPRTWHAVVSPTMPCISLSMFGLQLRHIFVNGIPGLVRYALHCLGLYRVGHCTCCKNCNAASTKVKGT